MRKLTLTSLFLLATLYLLLATSYAQIPHLINYQGKLTDTQGKPVPDGTHSLTFRIYDADSGGSLLWEETQNLLINRGIFSCLLGGVTNLNLPFDKPYWLAIKVGSDSEMTPRQQIASVGYAMRAERAEVADLADVATNAVNADRVGGVQIINLVQSGQAAGGDLAGTYPNPSITEGAISQAKLKTAIGEVSHSKTGWRVCNSELKKDGPYIYNLPGGQYGFYLERKVVKTHAGGCDHGKGGIELQINTGEDTRESSGTQILDYAPTVAITLRAFSGCNCFGSEGFVNVTGYARQRYVTSSGKDHWVFLLVDKETKDIASAYQASDHPSYGTSVTEKEIPHPFADYNPDKQEIVLVDNAILPEIKAKVTSNKGMLSVINEDYEIEWSSHPVYTEREIIEIDQYGDKPGKVIAKMKTPEWAKIVLGKDEIYLKRRVVESLPEYVLYKSLRAKQ